MPDQTEQETRPDPREIREAFGTSLRQRRAARGWTQDELGARAGVSGSAVGLIEAAKNGPSLTVAVLLAAAVDTTVDAMTGTAAHG